MDLLEKHGTKAFALPVGAIVSAARADLKLRDRKREERAAGGSGGYGRSELQGQHYAFHRRHVVRAKTVADLIEKALRYGAVGIQSSKKNTRLIYGNAKLLKSALKTVGERK